MSNSDRRALLDAIEEAYEPTDATIPTPARLVMVADALSVVREFLVEPTALSVIRTANAGEPRSITFEDIGRLVVWADDIRGTANHMIEWAEKVDKVARGAYDLADGYRGDGTEWTDLGGPRDYGRELAEALAERNASDA